MLYRGFRYLHSRILLDQQANVLALEAELDLLDKHDKTNKELRLQDRDFDVNSPRRDPYRRDRWRVLDDIREALRAYGEFRYFDSIRLH